MSESCSTFEFSRRRVQNKEVKVVTILLLQILSNCQTETSKAAQLKANLLDKEFIELKIDFEETVERGK